MCLAILVWASSAYGWSFQREQVACFEAQTTAIVNATPATMLMLDRSGSMRELSQYCCVSEARCGYLCGPSLWTLATVAIEAVVRALTQDNGPDEVLFALGFFPYVSIDIEADAERADTYARVVARLDASSPGGHTPTGAAIDAMRESATMNMVERPVAGVLITDGVPTGGIDPLGDALLAACALRAQAKSIYVIGLSGMTDEAFNNKIAAASGTGCCGPTATPGCPDGVGLDPCSTPQVDKTTCHGSFQAYSSDGFKDAMLHITQEIVCSVALETSPDDPSALRVTADGAIVGESVPYRSSDNAQGWYYPNAMRDRIALSPFYCQRLQSGEITAITTQLACQCAQTSGEACEVVHAARDVCPQGQWSCAEGLDRCLPEPLDRCPFPCVGYQLGARCHVDNGAPGFDGDDDWLEETNRCKIGAITCTEAGPVCQQLFQAIPELCNGLDDDCDGRVDNIVESWAKPQFQSINLDPAITATCHERNACLCPDGSAEHLGIGNSASAEFHAHLRDWTPVCQCAAALND